MRMLIGSTLGLLGLSAAMLWLPEGDDRRQLTAATEIATQGIATLTPATDHRGPGDSRSFSPATPLYVEVRPTQRPATPRHAAATSTATGPAPQVAASPPVREAAAPSWPTGLFGTASAVAHQIIEPPARTPVAAPAQVISTQQLAAVPPAFGSTPVPPRKLRPTDEDELDELTRNLQRELRRVGCYDGEVDGDWGPASKRGMSAFTDRVNASLPVGAPDYILLTLVEGHRAQACGPGCPSGQTSSADGRCQPKAVLAAAPSPRSTSPTKLNPGTGALATDAAPPGPIPTLTRTATAQLPVVVYQSAPATAAAPLPGRMAIGAPLPQPHGPSPSLSAPAERPPSLSARLRDNADTEPMLNARRAAAKRPQRRAKASRPARTAAVYRQAPRSAAPRYRRPSRSWTATFYQNITN